MVQFHVGNAAIWLNLQAIGHLILGPLAALVTGYAVGATVHELRRRYFSHTHAGRRDWFDGAVFLVPRGIREPWLGDLREDRVEMARKGAPRWWIEVCTVCQLLVLLGQILWGIVVEITDAARRLG